MTLKVLSPKQENETTETKRPKRNKRSEQNETTVTNKTKQVKKTVNKYILLDVLVCSIAEYFRCLYFAQLAQTHQNVQ